MGSDIILCMALIASFAFVIQFGDYIQLYTTNIGNCFFYI